MRIGVASPFQQAGEGSVLPANEKRAHGEFRAEAAGEFILRIHGNFERVPAIVVLRVQPVIGHEADVREVKENGEAEIVCAGERWSERAEQHFDRAFVTCREMFAERLRQVLAALENGKRLQASERGILK
jgi:hypothetical protein